MNKIFQSILFLLPLVANSQVLNIDRENGQDSLNRKVLFAFGITFSSDKQKNNLLEFTNQSELDLFLKKNKVLIFLEQIEASFNGASILENNGYFQLRLRDNDKKRLAPDYYMQYQWNGVLGMQNRGLAGCNARFRFLEGKKDDLYMGIGGFYEIERWNPLLTGFAFENDSLSEVIRKIPRLNLALKTAIQIKKGIDFSASTFVQFPMNEKFQNFNNPRWFFDMNLYFTLGSHLSMKIHYDHNLDSYRPLPIDNYYYNLNLGFQISY
jgi:hypothetical protein